MRVKVFNKPVQEAGQDLQGAAAFPGKVEEVREQLGVVGQLDEDSGNPHLPAPVHGRFKIAPHRRFHRVQNDAQGERGYCASGPLLDQRKAFHIRRIAPRCQARLFLQEQYIVIYMYLVSLLRIAVVLVKPPTTVYPL